MTFLLILTVVFLVSTLYNKGLAMISCTGSVVVHRYSVGPRLRTGRAHWKRRTSAGAAWSLRWVLARFIKPLSVKH